MYNSWILVELLYCLLCATCNLAVAGPAELVVMRAHALQESFFGMHVSSVLREPWPSVPFGSYRTWDVWPGVAWSDLNPERSVFRWEALDLLVEKVSKRGVEIVYTFGYVPKWAALTPDFLCGNAARGSCSPPNLEAWTIFVQAVVGRYSGQIKFWELWNEPNAPNFWGGEPEDLVPMAEVAYQIIHEAGGVVLSPAPQGTSGDDWLRNFFAAGGNRFSDVVSFHGYLHGRPELIIDLVHRLARVMDEFGLADKPLWDTEHSWGARDWPYGDAPERQADWLARFLILSAAVGVDRSFWYMWDSAKWGTLFDKRSRSLMMPALVYREVHDWLVGRTPICSISGGVYSCKLAADASLLVLWSTTDQRQLYIDTNYTTVRNIFGVDAKITDGKIMLSETPVLVR
jgi:Glycosyl hydrolase catalytic core